MAAFRPLTRTLCLSHLQVAAQQGKWLGRQLRDRTLKTLGADSAATHDDSERAVSPSQKKQPEELRAKKNNEPNKEEAEALSPLLAPFEYSDKGKMAYIGGKAAVATVNVPTLGVPPVRARAYFLLF